MTLGSAGHDTAVLRWAMTGTAERGGYAHAAMQTHSQAPLTRTLQECLLVHPAGVSDIGLLLTNGSLASYYNFSSKTDVIITSTTIAPNYPNAANAPGLGNIYNVFAVDNRTVW